jgi:RNA polymerase sigma-70 factor, ECF subfamily
MPPTHDPRSDEALVAAANAGEAAAFEAVYHRYREWAASLAFRFCGDRDLAQDVVQETFAYLFGKFPGFQLRGSARLTAILYPAIRNTALAQRRKRRPDAATDAVHDFPDPRLSGDVEKATLAVAVGRLPEGQREVLLMRGVDEMAVAEIALALGIPGGTVKDPHPRPSGLDGRSGGADARGRRISFEGERRPDADPRLNMRESP